MSFGTVSLFDDGGTVRFEREIAASIETVWEAITAGARLSDWLAPCSFDARLGGEVHVDFGEGQRVNGHVTDWQPPSRLEYTWNFTDEPDSILLFELEGSSGATMLTLEHRKLPPEQSAGYGAGWHAHLDMLRATVEGTAPVDWEQRFNSVLYSYLRA